MTLSAEIEPGPHCWKAGALTAKPTLPPKICSKALSLLLAKVSDSIVDPDQTCSVPGRSISSNLFLLCDMLDYIAHTNERGILISLDQEKAFDWVNRSFLINLLLYFGFDPCFCNWISTFCNLVNDFLSGPLLL